MLFDIAFAFLVILGYLVAIIMAGKTSKSEVTLSEADIDRIVDKLATKLQPKFVVSDPSWQIVTDGVHPDFLKGGKYWKDPSEYPITINESPVVVKSKTDGMELGGSELGKEEVTEEKLSTSALAALKGKKK